MDESIINGLFVIAGTMLGGLISYLTSRNAKEMKTLKTQVNNLTNQVVSYWNLEKLYSEEMSRSTSKPAITILKNFRDKVEDLNIDRPVMTEKEAKKILNKNL